MRQLLLVLVGIVIGAGGAIGMSRAASAQDAVKLSPQLYTVKLDNERVRVLEFRFRPGEKEPMHTHTPYVVYFLSSGTIRTTAPDGTTAVSSVKQGDTAYRDVVSHATENIGRNDVRALIVEWKSGNR